ncbi:MAG: hydantoinase B/oxoprolinase family protein, partial [Deltaproteobacteria bacterium]|nr:hydantoinase B/oxoprolinase family protein [Deltaproteobacteria bacterium]
ELGMGRTPDVEIQELISPVRILAFEEVTDTAGPGKYRGGIGHLYRVQYLADTLDGVLWGNGTREWSVPSGLFGGKNPKPNVTTIENPDGQIEEITINSFIKVRKGDIITLHGMGGAGFGNPFEREVDRVQRDVRDGFVSVEKAKEEYGVVINPGTMEVDVETTEVLRKKMAAQERS